MEAGRSISAGLAVSFDKKLGMHLGYFTSVSTESLASAGGMIGVSVGFSPNTRSLESVVPTSVVTGDELTLLGDLAKTKISVALGEAGSAMQKLNLGKSRASEAQMGEVGTRIACKGAKEVFRCADTMAERYGGQAADYVKVSSSAYLAKDGLSISTHWVENTTTAAQHEFKSIVNEFIKSIRRD